MRLIRLSVTFCLLALIACNHTGTKRASTPSNNPNVRTITISREILAAGISDTLQLGRMRQGEVIAKDIRIINADTLPMVILHEETTCGCTKAQYSREPISPGASSDIHIEFDSHSQMGWQMKRLGLYFANSDNPLKIYIDAEVE